jgi:hypothetical protein
MFLLKGIGMKNKSDSNDVADIYGFNCSAILHYLL